MRIRRGVSLLILLVSVLFALLIVVVYVLGLDVGAPAAEASGARSMQPAGTSSIGVQAWQTEIVEMPGYFDHMSDRSLRFDSAGNPHIVYGGDRLYYAKSNGETWQVEIVDLDVGTGMGASLDLDSADNPHISYLDLTNVNLKYAHWNGESWEFQVVDKAYPYQERTSIAIDSADQPHIAYRKMEWLPPDYNCPGLGHAHWDGVEWQIDRFNDCGSFASMALDSADRPHITFYESGKINHATNLTGTWAVDTIGNSDHGYGSSVAVDSQDRPHVVYVDHQDSGQLIYAYWDGGNWISSAVGSSYGGLNLSLTLDVSDTVHIADFSDYILLNGNTAQDISSPNYNEFSSFSSIALDGNGWPAICYLGLNSQVWCKRWNGDEWISEVVHQGANAGWSSSLAIDSSGEPHISYYRSYNYNIGGGGAIRYAYRSGETWNTETVTYTYVPANLHSGWDTLLAVDSNNEPHVSFWYDYQTSGYYYGHRDGETWEIEPIAAEAGAPEDMVLDSLDQPHVAFVYHSTLRHGYRIDGEWILEDVDTSVNTPVVDLALDGSDRPHFIYIDYSSGTPALTYAKWTGADWVYEIIESQQKEYTKAKLILDSMDRPHVAYIISDDNETQLKYATKIGGPWEIEGVDSYRWSMDGPSILLDGGDSAVIVFRYWPSLKIATRSGGAWIVKEAFEIKNNIDSLTAVANDAGELFVSYYDERGHGLVLAGPGELPEHLYLPAVLK